MTKIDFKKHSHKLSLALIVALFVVAVLTSVLALRHNNLRAVELRQVVYSADQQAGDVETALNDLRQYIYSHMNTNLRTSNSGNEPPIQLASRFNKAIAAEQARIAALGGANQVYVDAQRECERSSLPLTSRAQCMQDYISARGQGASQLNLPPKELYTFDFASPLWSPDLAGFSILASITLGLVIVAWIISRLIARLIRPN